MTHDIGEMLNIPFVLDYRDLVLGNAHDHILAENTRFLDSESQWLGASSLVTTISKSLTDIISQRVECPQKCRVLSNGYSEEEFENIVATEREAFTITYAGSLYPPLRTIDPVFAALKMLDERQELPPWRFEYYGNWFNHITAKSEEFGIAENVISRGFTPREEVLRALKSSHLLTVITSVENTGSSEQNGIVTSKLFDCLAVKRPILLVAPEGSDARNIIQATESGECATGEPKQIAAALGNVLSDGQFNFSADAYCWNSLGHQLDEMLRNIVT